MVSILKATIVLLALLISANGHILPPTIPSSIRALIKPAHQFHASVDGQLDAAKQRLRLLNRELIREKKRSKILSKSLQVSLIRADLRFDESKAACNALINYNRSVVECARLPIVEGHVERVSKSCEAAKDPEACFANRLVGFQVLKMIFELRCEEVAKQELTIETTRTVCKELKERFEERKGVKTVNNPIVLELRGVLIGMDMIGREIKALRAQIDAFTPDKEPVVLLPSVGPELSHAPEVTFGVTPEPEYSPLV